MNGITHALKIRSVASGADSAFYQKKYFKDPAMDDLFPQLYIC